MVQHTRTLDFKIAFAIGLGTMIAAGIFSTSGLAVAAIRSYAVLAFVIAALVAAVTAAAYSEFASVYSENGGGYLFLSRTFKERDLLTYGTGMSLFLGYTGTTAFYLATMDHFLFETVLHGYKGVLPSGTTGIAVAVLLGALNARGTEESGGFQLIITGAKVAVLIAFIAGAFQYAGPASAVGTFGEGLSPMPGAGSILGISALAFITFFGFSAIAASAGEIIEPKRTVPLAIAASMITVTILYTLVIVAMVNSPVPADVIAEQGEVAMISVAEAFLGPIGRSLIVAGAVFSMISASNASILAASGIGSLMGRRGQAPRPFARIHPRFGTPFWSVTTATATIVALLTVFMALFPSEGPALAGIHLGIQPLNGFATLNLLLPLAVVNVALIYSRRRFPDLERGFRVPGVPVVPIVGILANVALIYNLPRRGVALGVGLTIAMVGAYLWWGGKPEIDELVEQVVSPTPASDHDGTTTDHAAATTVDTGASADDVGATADDEGATADDEVAAEDPDRHTILVPVARPDRAVRYVRLAAALGRAEAEDPLVRVLTTTELPDQTPNELATETARERTERMADSLAEADIDVEYTVEGHISRDVAFDVVQTVRDHQADLVVMGYAEDHPEITEQVERKAPCDVVFAGRGATAEALDVLTIGAGGGPHQAALLGLVNGLGRLASAVHLVNVVPTGDGGTPERPEETLAALDAVKDIQVHNVTDTTVADGLVDAAASHGGTLFIGASRDWRLRRMVFGSTPDRVIARAREADVPVIVYSSARSVPERLEDRVFPIYRYLHRRLFGRSERRNRPTDARS